MNGSGAREGINVVGLLSSASGLGNTARTFISALRQQGYPVAGFDLAAYVGDVVPDLEDGRLFSTIDALPFDTNLVITAADRLPQMWLRHAPSLLDPRFRNAGLFFWELTTIPPAWLPSLRIFDGVVTCSHYVRQAFESFLPDVPTVFAEHPIGTHQLSESPESLRRRFEIPVASLAFCCIFDMRSGLVRKNPLGSIRAWKRAFPDDANVCLVIKTHGGTLGVEHHWAELNAAIGGDARIKVISEQIPHQDVLDLLGCCDVLVSLHRSEGLGLVPLEAMSMGKAVIATGYSGNLTFMTQQNSLLVNYRLTPPIDERPILMPAFAGKAAVWADPDLEGAAACMRRCRDEVGLLEKLGAQARADIHERQRTAWAVPFVQEMLSALSVSTRVSERRRLRAQIAMKELTNPMLRRKNASTVARLLKTRLSRRK
jgi:glycosyltransferase involved in cell wall biosynthesis